MSSGNGSTQPVAGPADSSLEAVAAAAGVEVDEQQVVDRTR